MTEPRLQLPYVHFIQTYQHKHAQGTEKTHAVGIAVCVATCTCCNVSAGML